jgi:hypothetical protein
MKSILSALRTEQVKITSQTKKKIQINIKRLLFIKIQFQIPNLIESERHKQNKTLILQFYLRFVFFLLFLVSQLNSRVK